MAEKEMDPKTKFLSEWVKEMGISDGKNPDRPVTQAYVWEIARNVINKLEKK